MICRLLFADGHVKRVDQPADVPADLFRRRIEALTQTPVFRGGPFDLPPLIEWVESTKGRPCLCDFPHGTPHLSTDHPPRASGAEQ